MGQDGHRQVSIARDAVAFPEGPGGDAARALLPGAVRRSHDSLCTVSRTVELGTPATAEIV